MKLNWTLLNRVYITDHVKQIKTKNIVFKDIIYNNTSRKFKVLGVKYNLNKNKLSLFGLYTDDLLKFKKLPLKINTNIIISQIILNDEFENWKSIQCYGLDRLKNLSKIVNLVLLQRFNCNTEDFIKAYTEDEFKTVLSVLNAQPTSAD